MVRVFITDLISRAETYRFQSERIADVLLRKKAQKRPPGKFQMVTQNRKLDLLKVS